MTSLDIVVEAASPRRRREAERVAAELDLPGLAAAGTDAEFALRRTETRWELHALAATASGPIYAHFGPPVPAWALRGNLLAKASADRCRSTLATTHPSSPTPPLG